MTTIQVQICVQREAAIRAGSAVFGRQTVSLSEADLQALTPAERAELAEAPTDHVTGAAVLANASGAAGRNHYIEVEVGGLEGVRAALAKVAPIRAAREAERAQLEAEREAKRRAVIDWVLSAPVDALLCSDDQRGAGLLRVWPRVPWELPLAARGEEIPWGAPELTARKAALEAEVERRNAAQERVNAAEAERLAVQRAERVLREKAEREGYETEFREFAEAGHAGEAAQRAVREGYDIRTAVLDAVQAQLPTPSAVAHKHDEYGWEERTSPKADAFALLDRITAAVKAVERKPACVAIEVSRVMRIEEPPEDRLEASRKVTGVVVTLASPITADRYLLYYVE